MQSTVLISLVFNVTPTPLFSFHATCVPDQIRLLVCGEWNVRGGESVNKGEKDRIRTSRNWVKVVDRVLHRVDQSRPGLLVILHRLRPT